MTAYVFQPGQPVAIVSNGAVVKVLTVRGQEHGIATLDDGTRWYAASGLPVSGSAKRRLTVLNATLRKQLRVRARLLRIIELASILGDQLDLRARTREGDLDRAEGALKQVLGARALLLPPADRDRFWEKIEAQLDEAARGAVQYMKDDHST